MIARNETVKQFRLFHCSAFTRFNVALNAITPIPRFFSLTFNEKQQVFLTDIFYVALYKYWKHRRMNKLLQLREKSLLLAR